MEQPPDQQIEDDEKDDPPIPADAPVETPEADPRTEGAPDGGEPRTVSEDPDVTQEQIQEAFE